MTSVELPFAAELAHPFLRRALTASTNAPADRASCFPEPNAFLPFLLCSAVFYYSVWHSCACCGFLCSCISCNIWNYVRAFPNARITGKQTLGQEYCGVNLMMAAGDGGSGGLFPLSKTPLRMYTVVRVVLPYLQVGRIESDSFVKGCDGPRVQLISRLLMVALLLSL